MGQTRAFVVCRVPLLDCVYLSALLYCLRKRQYQTCRSRHNVGRSCFVSGTAGKQWPSDDAAKAHPYRTTTTDALITKTNKRFSIRNATMRRVNAKQAKRRIHEYRRFIGVSTGVACGGVVKCMRRWRQHKFSPNIHINMIIVFIGVVVVWFAYPLFNKFFIFVVIIAKSVDKDKREKTTTKNIRQRMQKFFVNMGMEARVKWVMQAVNKMWKRSDN